MVMAAIEQSKIITIDDYEAYPDDERIEVFEGVPYAMASPSLIHQRLSIELSYLLKDYIRKKKGMCEVLAAPFDVKLSDDLLTIVQPDVMIVCDPSKLDKNRCNGAPDFIIEIVSSGNAAHDYVKKLNYYQYYGVKEYWIVDPDNQVITIYDFERELYAKRYTFDDKVKVGIYEDFYIDFSPLKELLQ